MSNSMIDSIRKLIEGAEIPANDSITDEAIAPYESGQNVLIRPTLNKQQLDTNTSDRRK
ncbi:MAG TPA: hypothetical protein VF043_17650 [Ktedonobacteraceae bacterium]